MSRSSRATRNRQFISIAFSVIVVLSMGLSLVAVFTPSRVEPTVTPTSIFITPTATPIATATPSQTPKP